MHTVKNPLNSPLTCGHLSLDKNESSVLDDAEFAMLMANWSPGDTMFVLQSDWGNSPADCQKYLKENPIDKSVLKLKHMGKARLWKLYRYGIVTVLDIAGTDAIDLADMVGISDEDGEELKNLTPK